MDLNKNMLSPEILMKKNFKSKYNLSMSNRDKDKKLQKDVF